MKKVKSVTTVLYIVFIWWKKWMLLLKLSTVVNIVGFLHAENQSKEYMGVGVNRSSPWDYQGWRRKWCRDKLSKGKLSNYLTLPEWRGKGMSWVVFGRWENYNTLFVNTNLECWKPWSEVWVNYPGFPLGIWKSSGCYLSMSICKFKAFGRCS